MTYATQSDLIDRYGEQMLVDLTDRGEPPDEIGTDAVARALADTDALIDGYLKGRYQLPLATVPALVRDLAITIAIYKLHCTSAADKIADDYAAAVKTLAQIASGTVRLDVAGVEPAAAGTSGVRANSGTQRTDACDLKGFV